MADPQQEYTEAQLQNGTTLRFLGTLSPDQVRDKVSAFKLKRPDMFAPPAAAGNAKQMGAMVKPGAEGLEADPNNPAHNPYAGVPGAQPMNRPVTGADLIPGAVAGGAAATIMGGPAIVRTAAKHPILSSMLIGEARKLPYVGKYIPPYSELLPLLLSGRGEAKPKPEPELDATGENRPFAGGIDEPKPGKILDATGENKPFAGGMDEYRAPVPKAAPQKILSPIESTSYPPDKPPVIQQTPIPGSKADLAETKAIQEQVRDAAEGEDRTRLSQEKREWFKRNDPSTPKGELIQTAKSPSDIAFEKNFPSEKFEPKMSSDELRAWQESIGNPLPKEEDIGAKVTAARPKLTRAEVNAAREARATADAAKSAAQTPATDLTPEWTRALEDLKAKKGLR